MKFTISESKDPFSYILCFPSINAALALSVCWRAEDSPCYCFLSSSSDFFSSLDSFVELESLEEASASSDFCVESFFSSTA